MSEILCKKEQRWRSENFSKAYLAFLCEFVQKNITITKSKHTNAITNAEKTKVLKEITDSVNARQGRQKKEINSRRSGGIPILRQSWKLQFRESASIGKKGSSFAGTK